ncbi:MAG: CHRD domain-containing protein, partial [Planctomycetes bacterium]|nr:CHRD domain-containing protein [Planctomycetota bacterium]
LAERDWEIVLKEGDTQMIIAHLAIDADGDLTFRWEPAAGTVEAAANLCNCALALSVPDKPVQAVALREVVTVEPLVVELDKPSPKGELRIDLPPDASAVYAEILGIGGPAFQVKPSPTLLADKGEAWLTVDDGGGLLTLKLQTSLKRGLTLDVSPHIQPPGVVEPQPLVVKKLPQQVNFAMARLQALQTQIQQATVALRQNLPAQQRALLQQNLAQWQQQEPDFQKNVKLLGELQTLLEANENRLEIDLRVYCDADTTQIELIRAGPPPEEPETP